MSVTLFLAKAGKKVHHLFIRIPTHKRAAVHKNESITQTELSTAARSFFLAKLEQRKIDATWNHFVMHISTPQSFPVSNDGPDSFRQRYDTVRGGEDEAFGCLGNAIRNATLAPVFRIDIF